MVKRHTTLSLDNELIDKAKEMGINISELTNEAIKERLGKVDVLIPMSAEKCEFCGREDKKATRDDLTGLTWMYPDERWICNECLLVKGRRIIPK